MIEYYSRTGCIIYAVDSHLSYETCETDNYFSPQDAINKILNIGSIMDDVCKLKTLEEPALESKNAIIMAGTNFRLLFNADPS